MKGGDLVSFLLKLSSKSGNLLVVGKGEGGRGEGGEVGRGERRGGEGRGGRGGEGERGRGGERREGGRAHNIKSETRNDNEYLYSMPLPQDQWLTVPSKEHKRNPPLDF